jgi:hypothetical protein
MLTLELRSIRRPSKSHRPCSVGVYHKSQHPQHRETESVYLRCQARMMDTVNWQASCVLVRVLQALLKTPQARPLYSKGLRDDLRDELCQFVEYTEGP